MRLILFLILSIISYLNIYADSQKKVKVEKPSSSWVMDCKERRECNKNCMEMRVMHGRWGGYSYENQIRVECIRSCQQSVVCLPESDSKE